MAIIILPICFISIFLSLGILPRASKSKKELLIFTTLIFSAALVIITEVLSLFHQLNYSAILMVWTFIAVANILYLYAKRDNLCRFYKRVTEETRQYFSELSRLNIALLASVFVILAIVFLQGIVYPPTNWDSMTYHLARIVSWISDRSVEHFPTAITRQIYQPPFAEYVIMHVNILSGNDYFSAAVQFFFLLFSLAVIAGTVQGLGLSRKYQLGAIVLAATIPEVVLQASSTQNDIVVSFFILTAFYCAFKAISTLQLKYCLFLGLAVGLGLLTKGTAYIYLAPILIIFIIATIITLFKTRKLTYLSYALMVGLIAIFINSSFYYRNYKLSQNIFGVDKTETRLYANEKMNPVLLLSNIIKNAGLHLGLMYVKPVSAIADSGIHKLHTAAGANINDPAVNYRGMRYGIGTDATDEDAAPNLFHFLLILFAGIILLIGWRKWKDKPAVYSLFVVVILQVIFFCIYLKWQPWNSRLHVPVFLMAVPLICYAFSLLTKFKKSAFLMMPVLLLYAFLTVWHNEWRPVSSNIFSGSRYQKYFASYPAAYAEYDAVAKAINQDKFKNIGLIIGVNSWEYPLFTTCYSRELNPIHINVNNITAKAGDTMQNADCIVSTTINKAFIDYNNRRYYNQDTGNKVIYLYK